MASFEFLEDDQTDSNGQARFTVFGVGGAGGNAVQHMLESDIQGVKFVCANTDKQALDRMNAQFKIQLGEQSTRGLGAGANPNVGQAAAEESRDLIRQHLEGTDMVFVTAGMGGGTGTGAAPVVAEIAKEMGILTVGVVTTPFNFEGKRRLQSAEQGIEALEAHVDSLIIIPNQRLLKVFRDISMKDAYKKADDVLLNAVRSIFDLVVRPGHINLDFADLKTAMSTRGYAMMGAGLGRGENRARQAAEQAIRSPLLDNVTIMNAKGILINVTGGDDVTFGEIEEITDVVNQIVDLDEGQVFYGTVFDPDARDEISVTVIATGLTRNSADSAEPVKRPNAHVQVAQHGHATQAVVEDDDVPAIQRQNQDAAAAASSASTVSAARPTPMSIQDYLKNQQRK
ncbi:cell division protein FtsZ [Acinetobacter johnsonii]|jgi:cell division protein FtsZ|uniref:Cell division protein FtsZ n=1 Tax=Acinetobacter johnsonii TaxID=40214 RepID=A0A2W5AQQ8_ACIJO|nr:cell division protein FtsZ [Acinetobacter johnsonii]MDA0775795.1 cell division protein FtsZ [Pseudomonadota bacterium]OHC23643.1 MAG: cell division protein FtsZ [Pseudomonadales bacterium RIFCSPHIGHO2_12_FULL_40_16]MCF7643326.1 cell division protein FtsZ [Acinetobacter johnsonii]MDA1171047.1 cell division protein FtsZ [Pseudomonadota bacterium]PZO96920.1 MAG: cell division protein FtsZ [Acinetobacter johnsonii]